MRKYACFTREQQEMYENMSKTARDYLEYRRQGLNMTDAYKRTGYQGIYASQSAKALEKRFPELLVLLKILEDDKQAMELAMSKDGKLSEEIKAKARQEKTKDLINKIAEMDSETAKRVKFYNDIISGKIKTTRTTIKKDKNDNIISKQVVEVDDVDTKIKARQALDNILGLNSVVELATSKIGEVTVKFVDATKREELPKSDDNIELDNTEVVDVDDKDIEGGEDE